MERNKGKRESKWNREIITKLNIFRGGNNTYSVFAFTDRVWHNALIKYYLTNTSIKL